MQKSYRQRGTRGLPLKARDTLAFWAEFPELVEKYDAVDMTIGVPGMDIPDFLKEEFQKVVLEPHNQYTSLRGHPDLQKALSDYFAKSYNKEEISDEEVMITCGATQALFCACMQFLEEGDECLLFEPFFPNYIEYVQYSGATPVTVGYKLNPETSCWEFDFEQFEASITERTKLVIFTNPHNPTGKMMSQEDIEKFSAILDKHPKILVLSDDVYWFLPLKEGVEYHRFANYGNNFNKTITTHSFGKLLACTGWKVGWAVGPADLIAHMSYANDATCQVITVPCQVALARALPRMNEPYKGFSNYISWLRNTFREGKEEGLKVYRSFQNLPLRATETEGGYFVPFEITEECKQMIPQKYFMLGNYETEGKPVFQQEFKDEVPLDFAFCRWLAVEKGIVMTPMSCFCLEGSKNYVTNYARLPICKPKEFFQQPKLLEKAALL